MAETDLEQRVRVLEAMLAAFVGSSQYQFQKDAKFYDGRNIQTGSTTGTMVGTAANQKLGFFGATPIIQPVTGTTTADINAALTALGLVHF